MVFTAAQKRAYAIRMAAARATAAKKAASARAAKKKPEAKKKPSRRQGFQTHLTGRGDYYSTAGMDYPGGGELGKSFATAIGGPSFAELESSSTRSAQNAKIIDRIRRLCSE